jgi:protein-disulfide isomerase
LPDDAQRGDPLAPVTIVEFADFQCPFSARVTATLATVFSTYGERVRFVFKHNPLPFHARARAAAEASRVVLALGGNAAFFKFHDRAFGNLHSLTDENFARWAAESGISAEAFKQEYAAGREQRRVAVDMELAQKIGAQGTPSFRINGVTVNGAQPFEKFKSVIDAQLAAAKAEVAGGTRPENVYAELVNKNLKLEAEKKTGETEEEEDTTVWKVPVASDDPVRGRADALVTIVVFSDFQCPFCKRVEDTLTQLRDAYGEDVRFVWKDNPLPFHPRAEPAAELARYVFTEKGNAGFWQAHDALFASAPQLEDEQLESIAGKLGVNVQRAKAAIKQKRFAVRIQDSVALATDFQARGTPHFFVNGVRLAGAQPIEKFKALIDKQLAAAKALVDSGVPRARVYEAVIREGKEPPPPETKQVAAANPNAPSRGPANAKVVIQEFADFQCPFCVRVQPTLDELTKRYGAQIKLVYRHLPLPFHKNAELAAEAAEEALAQKGAAGFWAFHDALFKAQSVAGTPGPDAIDRPHLESIAAAQHLDLARFREALDSHKHLARVQADKKAAEDAKISGTPGFLINEYYLSGAQPKVAFERLIRRVLSEPTKR